MWALPCGPRLWSVANAQVPTFSPFRCPPHGIGHAAVDSDHAECIEAKALPVNVSFKRWPHIVGRLFCTLFRPTDFLRKTSSSRVRLVLRILFGVILLLPSGCAVLCLFLFITVCTFLSRQHISLSFSDSV